MILYLVVTMGFILILLYLTIIFGYNHGYITLFYTWLQGMTETFSCYTLLLLVFTLNYNHDYYSYNNGYNIDYDIWLLHLLTWLLKLKPWL